MSTRCQQDVNRCQQVSLHEISTRSRPPLVIHMRRKPVTCSQRSTRCTSFGRLRHVPPELRDAFIVKILKTTGAPLSHVAKALGMSPETLRRREPSELYTLLLTYGSFASAMRSAPASVTPGKRVPLSPATQAVALLIYRRVLGGVSAFFISSLFLFISQRIPRTARRHARRAPARADPDSAVVLDASAAAREERVVIITIT